MHCSRFLRGLDVLNSAFIIAALGFLILALFALACPTYRWFLFWDDDLWFYMTSVCFVLFAVSTVLGGLTYLLSLLVSTVFCQCGWIKEQSIPSYK